MTYVTPKPISTDTNSTNKRNLFLFMGWLLMTALLLPNAANAGANTVTSTKIQSIESALYARALVEHKAELGLKGVWRPRSQIGLDPVPDKSVDCRPKPGCQNNHGTYNRDPYYRFMKNKEGNVEVISDHRLQATLIPVPGKPKQFKIEQEYPEKATLLLTFSTLMCEGEESPCFEIYGKPQSSDLLNKIYVPFKKTYLDPKSRAQSLSSMFTKFPANFDYATQCYDLVTFNPRNPGQKQCGHLLFADPTDPSLVKTYGYFEKHYDHGASVAIPFGWKFKSRGPTTVSSNQIIFNENNLDIVKTYNQSLGWKTGVDILGIIDTQVNHSNIVQDSVNRMKSSGNTDTEFNTLNQQFSLVVDKANLRLDESEYGFTQRVKQLLIAKKDKSSEDILCKDYKTEFECALHQLVNDFGTHYPYALTFGKIGKMTSRLKREDVMTMVENKFETSTGASVGVHIPVSEEDPINGPKVSINAGIDYAKAHSDMKKMSSMISAQQTDNYCLGGGGCDNGVPTGEGVGVIFYDLRPISELLGPPFFNDDPEIAGLRDGLRGVIAERVFGPSPYSPASNKPSTLFYKFTDIELGACTNGGFSGIGDGRFNCSMSKFGVSFDSSYHAAHDVDIKYTAYKPPITDRNTVVALAAPPSSNPKLTVTGHFTSTAISSGCPITQLSKTIDTLPNKLNTKPQEHEVRMNESSLCRTPGELGGDWYVIGFKVQPVSASQLLQPK